jgi:hypothetical protein
MKFHPEFARWPLLLAAVTLMAAGLGLDYAAQSEVAYGLWALASAAFGGFMYAEGARHRDWNDKHKSLGGSSRGEPNTPEDPS